MFSLTISYLFIPFIWIYHRLWQAVPVRHVLVVQTAKIGDVVCATPVIHALRMAFPNAKLSMMVATLTAPLLQANPEVDEIMRVEMNAFKGLKGKGRLLHTLRRAQADTVIFLNPNLTFLLASYWCGIKRRLVVLPFLMGTTLRLASRFMTAVELQQPGELVHRAQQRVLGRIGAGMPSFLHTAYESGVAPLLLNNDQLWIGLGVSASNKLKELGQEKLTQIIDSLLAQTSYSLVLIGGDADRNLAQQLISHPIRIKDSTGQIALAELPQFLKQLSLYIGVDSGITYLADAVGVPVVSIIGPVDSREQGPMGKFVEIIQRDEPCAPCSRVFRTVSTCKVGTRACIQNIAVHDIIARALNLLQQVEVAKHDA